MNKYMVTVVRTGCVPVLANSESEAMAIADRQHTEVVNWSDDWYPTDAELDDSVPDGACVSASEY